MMDYFYIFQYQLSDSQTFKGKPTLKYLKYTKININQTEKLYFQDRNQITQFHKLDEDITQSKVLLKKAIQKITREICDSMVNFVNVTILCQDIKLFLDIIPRECTRRELAVPFVFTNFFDLKQHMKKQCSCPYKKWQDIAEYMQICSSRQADLKSETEILQRIIKRLHKDRKIPSTNQRCSKQFERMVPLNVDYTQKKYKYFKIIGIPFKAFPAQILNILAPEISERDKQICFIYQRDRFSGRAMVKVPESYEQTLIKKNRMYIGSRYIQLEISSQNEFQKAKIKLEHKETERGHNVKTEHEQNYKIGRHRSRSRSPSSHSRSRDKTRRQQDKKSQVQVNPFESDFNLNSGQYGIKVRGLPYVFSEWDVQNMFSFYNIISGSVKLGIKPGTSMKNGQAVILMRNYNDAKKALQMNGFKCMGRYIQVRVISNNEYIRYK